MLSDCKHMIVRLCLVWMACMAHASSAGAEGGATREPDGTHFDVTWLGGPTMLVRFGDFTLLTDPTLGETFAMGDPNDAEDAWKIRSHRRLTALKRIDLHDVDLLLLSHMHPDHFDEQAAATLDPALPVILPTQDERAAIAKGFHRSSGLSWGQSREFSAGSGRVTITAVPARHSRDPAIAEQLGIGNGYWIEFSRGNWKRSLYWTGDSMPTEDVVSAIKSRGTPDVLVAHVGGVGPTGPFGQISMRAADVVELAAAIRPRFVLPIHHSTYSFYREPIGELVRQSAGHSYRLDLIDAGATVVYPMR